MRTKVSNANASIRLTFHKIARSPTDSNQQTPAAKPPQVTYLTAYAGMPIDTPVGHPHIVDPESVDAEFLPKDLTVADVVVTTLFKFQPQALTTFLDLDRPRVHYIQGGRLSRLDICIKREGRMVTLGFLNEQDVGGWDEEYEYRINGKATEPWTPIRMRIGTGHDTTRVKEIQGEAPRFAFTIFMHQPWKQYPGQEIEWFSGLSYGQKI